MNENIANIEVTENKTTAPSTKGNWAMSPAGALSSTLLSTTSTVLEGADLYYELQLLNQQEGISVNKDGFKARKEQGENQKWATRYEGIGSIVGAGTSMALFVGGLGVQKLQKNKAEMTNANAFDKATRGPGIIPAGVTDMTENTLAGSKEVRGRIDALVNEVNFEHGPTATETLTLVAGTTPFTDEEILQLATPEERKAVNKQANDKMKELSMNIQQNMQVWNQIVPVLSSAVSGGFKFATAAKQYAATLAGATAERFSGLGQQFSALSNQEQQEVSQLLTWMNTLYQTIDALDAANRTGG